MRSRVISTFADQVLLQQQHIFTSAYNNSPKTTSTIPAPTKLYLKVHHTGYICCTTSSTLLPAPPSFGRTCPSLLKCVCSCQQIFGPANKSKFCVPRTLYRCSLTIPNLGSACIKAVIQWYWYTYSNE